MLCRQLDTENIIKQVPAVRFTKVVQSIFLKKALRCNLYVKER